MSGIAKVAKDLARNAAAAATRIVRRGIIKGVSAAGFAQVAGGTDENFDNAELWQQFGLASRPSPGGEAVVLLVDGNPDQPIVVATTNRTHRPALSVGEVSLHGELSGAEQTAVKLKADGDVDLYCWGGKYVHVGGPTGAEPLILGDTFVTNLSTFLDVLIAQFAAPPYAAVGTAATALKGQLASCKAAKAKGA